MAEGAVGFDGGVFGREALGVVRDEGGDLCLDVASALLRPAVGGVQREGDEEEEPVQGSFTDAAVQREGEDEEEMAEG